MPGSYCNPKEGCLKSPIFSHSWLQLPPEKNDFILYGPRLTWVPVSFSKPEGERHPGKCSSWHLCSEDRTLGGRVVLMPGLPQIMQFIYLLLLPKTSSWRSQTVSQCRIAVLTHPRHQAANFQQATSALLCSETCDGRVDVQGLAGPVSAAFHATVPSLRLSICKSLNLMDKTCDRELDGVTAL